MGDEKKAHEDASEPGEFKEEHEGTAADPTGESGVVGPNGPPPAADE